MIAIQKVVQDINRLPSELSDKFKKHTAYLEDCMYYLHECPDKEMYSLLCKNPEWILSQKQTCKVALTAWAICRRKPYQTSAGKYHNTTILANEVYKRLKLNPLTLDNTTCDNCSKTETSLEDPIVKSKDGVCIHIGCEDAWVANNGEFNYEHDESDEE